jgi:dihydrofolate reductase
VRAPLAIVAAVADNGVIGKSGGLPWRIPEDLKFFKQVTMGHAVIMGRRTFEEVNKPLPGRRNIVVTKSRPVIEGCEVAATFDEAVALARQTDEEPRVIGGAAIYAAALPVATIFYLTEVHQKAEGDTHFPPFDREAWRETSRRRGETEGVEFVTLER